MFAIYNSSSQLVSLFKDLFDAQVFSILLRQVDPSNRYYIRELSIPFVEDVPLRYSIGQYFGKRRVVVARFASLHDAETFLVDVRKFKPNFKFDLLDSLF